MTSRAKQRFGGILIALLGGGGTFWTWQTALSEGHFSLKASLIFPAFLVLGLGLTLFPGYREERLARGEDLTGMEGMKLLTPRWWVILAVALLAGAANYLLLSRS